MFKPSYKKIFLAVLFFTLVFLSLDCELAQAANTGDIAFFNVEKEFDALARTQVQSVLVKITDGLYFYVEKSWWDTQDISAKESVLNKLDALSGEFSSIIRPQLVSLFGSEASAGPNGDTRLSLLFEFMNSAEGGYFREADGYIKMQVPTSNERKILYLSLANIEDSQLKVVLAHEFVHLITFNQKNNIFGAEEDTWLNEARADYSSTILGYDNVYEGSNLQRRVQDFTVSPSDSVVDWQGTKYDYASVSLFTHYLVDYYGVKILVDSLKSKYVGIESINYALQRAGYTNDFSRIFTKWTVAAVLNDCSTGQNHCYLNQNLKNLKLLPSINFLPITGNVSLSVANITQNWSGNWIKFIGGNGDLRVSFSSLVGLTFKMPYIYQDSGGSYAVGELFLDKSGKGEISLEKFGTDYKSLIIIPSLQSYAFPFGSQDSSASYPYSYVIYVTGSASVEEQDLIQQLLERIEELKRQIAELQSGGNVLQTSCTQITQNISIGSSYGQVGCLQSFLKNQGQEVYPEGLVTGYFGNLTFQAVKRFQEKYVSEILTPLGLSSGTGYVGPKTRAKINQLLSAN